MTAPKISILPAAPSRSDPTAFAAESDAFVAAQAGFVTQANNLATYVEVQANTVAPSLSYAEQAAASAALALIYKNDAAAAVTYQDLGAFALSKAITMVDGLVYRTAHDSDGGAWRERTQGRSWHQETLDTATRGSTRKFPSVAIIIAEANKITIFNGDDPACPMWMVFTNDAANLSGNASNTTISLAMENARLTIGSNLYDVRCIEFAGDRGARAGTGSVYGPYLGNISERNAGKDWANGVVTFFTSGPIIDRTVNDVAMTVLPNAPIDQATGLQIPTKAVATDGNGTYLASVIQSDGNIYDVGADGGNTATSITISSTNELVLCRSDGTVYVWNDIGAIAADGTSPDTTYTAANTFGTPTIVEAA